MIRSVVLAVAVLLSTLILAFLGPVILVLVVIASHVTGLMDKAVDELDKDN